MEGNRDVSCPSPNGTDTGHLTDVYLSHQRLSVSLESPNISGEDYVNESIKKMIESHWTSFTSSSYLLSSALVNKPTSPAAAALEPL